MGFVVLPGLAFSSSSSFDGGPGDFGLSLDAVPLVVSGVSVAASQGCVEINCEPPEAWAQGQVLRATFAKTIGLNFLALLGGAEVLAFDVVGEVQGVP